MKNASVGACKGLLTRVVLNHEVDIPLFATDANPLQLHPSPRAKILAHKDKSDCKPTSFKPEFQ